MAVLLAVVITATVVAAVTWFFAAGRTSAQLRRTSDEHRRQLRRQEEATAEVEQRAAMLELSLDALTAGVIVTGADGQELARNRLAAQVSLRAHEQTLVDATATELLTAARHGQPGEQVVETFGPPARILFVHAVPILQHHEIVGALAVIDDITDHHRIDATRRDFVANLSHELRTPVGAVSLLAEMLEDEDEPDTRRQLTSRLLLETERMTATIDDLLELSRIESETEDLDELVPVRELIDDAVARTRVAADAAGIEVGVVMPAEPIVTQGSRDQLLSALVNLLENAVKYSDVGDSVSVRARIDDDGVLQLAVQDTGRGIPARDLDRIFERFYRVDRSRDATTGGTGIGLSIVRHVALNHGGTATVESFEGDGSTFTLALPIVVPAAKGSDGLVESAVPTDDEVV